MATTRASRVQLILGITFIVLAVVLEVLVVPALTKLPAGTDRTAKYAGTMQAIDPATFQLGNAAPVTADRRIHVVETDDDTAVIESNLTLHTPAGDSEDIHSYAISRKDFQQVDAPKGTEVEDQLDAMTMSRPAAPSKSDFTVYHPATQTAQTVEYVGTREIDGREVYEFAGETTAPVKSPALLAQLQAGIAGLAKTGDGTTVPKAVLAGLAATLSPEQGAALEQLLTQLPDEVPLVFTSTNELKLAIDTQFGAPVETAQTQTVTVNIETGGQPVPLAAMSKVALEQTPASVEDNASFLGSNASKLAIIKIWVPLGLTVAGIALVGLGLRNRRRPTEAAPAGSDELVTQSS